MPHQSPEPAWTGASVSRLSVGIYRVTVPTRLSFGRSRQHRMRTPNIIRFVLAALCTTIVCIGVWFGVIGLGLFMTGSYYFFIRRSEITTPVTAASLVFAIFLAGSMAVDIAYFRKPESTFRVIFSIVTWIAMMACIYYEWHRSKKVAA